MMTVSVHLFWFKRLNGQLFLSRVYASTRVDSTRGINSHSDDEATLL